MMKKTHLGTTPSGKKVWLEKWPHEYTNFSKSDHLYAAVLHEANHTPHNRAALHRAAAVRPHERSAAGHAARVTHAKIKTGLRRSAHATKAKARDKTSDKINIDQLAKLFNLPDWDKIDEMNQQHYWEMSQGAGAEEAQMDAESAAQTEVYNQWYDAVERAASKLFDEHGLELSPTGKQGTEKRRYDFKIIPTKSWDDAANKIRETINGVGDLHHNNLREFLRSGPYTAKQAVLLHLGYIKRYPAVYGGLGANQMYERAW
jgi:hypothetical protein